MNYESIYPFMCTCVLVTNAVINEIYQKTLVFRSKKLCALFVISVQNFITAKNYFRQNHCQRTSRRHLFTCWLKKELSMVQGTLNTTKKSKILRQLQFALHCLFVHIDSITLIFDLDMGTSS